MHKFVDDVSIRLPYFQIELRQANYLPPLLSF